VGPVDYLVVLLPTAEEACLNIGIGEAAVAFFLQVIKYLFVDYIFLATNVSL